MAYDELIKDFAKWQAMADDAKGEINTPILELMIQGARAVRNLQRQALPCVEDPAILKKVLAEVMSSDLPASFDRAIVSTLADSMAAAKKSSWVGAILVGDSQTINRCFSEDKSHACLGMLLNIAGAVVGSTSVVHSVKSVLASAPHIPPETIWAFSAPLEMAQNFVGMLDQGDGGDQVTWNVGVRCMGRRDGPRESLRIDEGIFHH